MDVSDNSYNHSRSLSDQKNGLPKINNKNIFKSRSSLK